MMDSNTSESQRLINDIWLYSNYYGDMLQTSKRLYNDDEYYASVLILFNATELIIKSYREKYSSNFNDDIEFVRKNKLISEDEYNLLNDENIGVRKIRNIMAHRDAYAHSIVGEVVYQFSEPETWKLIFDLTFHSLLKVLNRIALTNRQDQ